MVPAFQKGDDLIREAIVTPATISNNNYNDNSATPTTAEHLQCAKTVLIVSTSMKSWTSHWPCEWHDFYLHFIDEEIEAETVHPAVRE